MLDDEKYKKKPFSVPEDFFQNFNSEILNKVQENKISKTKKINLWKSAGKWVSIAAIISGVIFTGLHYIEDKTENIVQKGLLTQTPPSNNDLSSLQNDYHQYIENEATRLFYTDLFYDDDL